jgi:FkbM family methyltransferase
MNYSMRAVVILTLLLTHTNYSQTNPIFYSQCGQDAFLFRRFFSQKTDGVFVDIGAHDGVTYSNTYFFEKHRGWKGLCVEPIPEVFQQLRQNRTCICVEGCIYDKADTARFLRVHSNIGEHTEMLSGIIEKYDPKHRQRIELETSNGAGFYKEITVKCYALNALLEANEFYHIDYISIDTEGGELDILKSIDFERFTIDVIDVENNYDDPEFERFLRTKGYRKLTDVPYSGDEIYVRSDWNS